MPRLRNKQSSKPTALPADADTRSRPAAWTVAALLAFFIGIVYLPSAHVPFIFDDIICIVQNESITQLWPLFGVEKAGPLNPPPEHPTSGRPLANLSFAVNYSFGGLNPTGYHVLNIAFHYFNAMLLWAITRRTLRLPYFDGRYGRSAEWLALAVAALWALHPLQTEAVIYATQRTELMMAFFYLATLYCSLHYWQLNPLPSNEVFGERALNEARKSRLRNRWLSLAIFSCLCGMASKEVMVSAPLIVLLFERTFLAGKLKTALRHSWPLYIGLASTWLLLAGLTLAGPRPDSAGFHLGIPPHVWWLTQSRIFFLYLKLVVWPWPLLIHYELPYATELAEAWIYVVPLLLLGILTLVLLWQNRPVGFLGTWMFAVLSPTFVVPVVTEMAAERRMYLALAPCVLLFVIGGYRLAQLIVRYGKDEQQPSRSFAPLGASIVLTILLALLFCFVNVSRLAAYENEMTLWLEVLKSQPKNSRAHFYLGTVLEAQGNPALAIEQYQEAIRLDPNPTQAHYRLGLLLNKKGDYSEAAAQFAEAARGLPQKNANMFNAEAVALFMAGRTDEAIKIYRRIIDFDPNFWPAYRNMGTALQKAGEFKDAVQAFESALRLNPQAIDIYNDLANSYLRLNQKAQARVALERGLNLAQTAGDTENIKKLSDALQANR